MYAKTNSIRNIVFRHVPRVNFEYEANTKQIVVGSNIVESNIEQLLRKECSYKVQHSETILCLK